MKMPIKNSDSEVIINGENKIVEITKEEVNQFYKVSLTPIMDEDKVKIGEVYLLQNVTELQTLAYYDSLTGLPNRTLFYDRLDSALFRANRTKKHIGLFYIDLDRFKDINDNFGHSAGDKFLLIVADRIKNRIRKTDTLCRLGGDEFTLIIENLENSLEAKVVAEDILNELQKTFKIHGSEVTIDCSIGIAIGPEDGGEKESLIRKADTAMYYAKELGGNNFVFSSMEIEEKRLNIYKMEMKLYEAVRKEQFKLYFQPLIKIDKNKVQLIGAEALIRWSQEDGSMIPPNDFISIAERNGIIHKIGIWVIEEVLRTNKVLRGYGININLSLNVSIRQFDYSEFISNVEEILIRYNETPVDLTFEITESFFFVDVEKGISDLNKLRKIGIKIALDDFGTGFSSMSYLDRLPIDYLKIDKTFIDAIDPNSSKNLATMILSIAHSLDLITVSEGIETKSQVDYMSSVGGEILQGYYYSKPLPLDKFIEYVKNFSN